MTTLVVGGDGNIDELGGRVGIAEGNDGDVDVAGLLDSLGIGAGVRDDDQTGLLERPGNVIGERTGGEATGDGLGTGVGGELQDGTLAVGTGADDADIGRVINGGDDAGSENDLLPVGRENQQPIRVSSFFPFRDLEFHRRRLNVPGLANVQDVDTIGTSLPEVRLHVNLHAVRRDLLAFSPLSTRSIFAIPPTLTSWSRCGTEQQEAAQCPGWWH